jgi:hypothetical protein
MAVITIYLPDNLREKLKSEDNVSGLIANLLEQHYQVPPEEIIKQVKTKIEAKEEAQKWLEDFKTHFATEELMEEYIKGASDSLKSKYKFAKDGLN